MNAASVAVDVAGSVAWALDPDAVFADLNTRSPPPSARSPPIVTPSGARFADVALMAPVAGRGLRTPALASGPGRGALRRRRRRPRDARDRDRPGARCAAARKLVRSVFMKGLAAAIGEALEAAGAPRRARRAVRRHRRDARRCRRGAAARLVEGSVRSTPPAGAEEMAAARAMLDELGVEPRIARRGEAWLRSLGAADG